MALDPTQTGVARGMALAVAASAASFVAAFYFQWPRFVDQDVLDSRLKLATTASLAPVVMLFVCIARLAKHRFATPQDIQGSALTTGTDRARLLQALLQNTLEQTVLALPTYYACSILFPSMCLPLVAVAAMLFALGRVLFFAGYAAGAPSRAAGFGLTFYPSVALLATVLAVLLRTALQT